MQAKERRPMKVKKQRAKIKEKEMKVKEEKKISLFYPNSLRVEILGLLQGSKIFSSIVGVENSEFDQSLKGFDQC